MRNFLMFGNFLTNSSDGTVYLTFMKTATGTQMDISVLSASASCLMDFKTDSEVASVGEVRSMCFRVEPRGTPMPCSSEKRIAR